MPVSIDGVRLYGADESTVPTAGQVSSTSITGQDGDEAFHVALEAEETMTLAGRATGIRLLDQGYPSDVTAASGADADQIEAAIAEWTQEFASLTSATQGNGWSLTDDERNRTLTVTATDGSWTRVAGAPWEVSWSLELTRGEGVFDNQSRSPSTATPGSSDTLAGTDLGTISERRIEISVDVETTPLAFADTSETLIVPTTGRIRRFTVTGRKTGSTSTLRSFDDTMRGNVGGDQQLTYDSGFPGTSHETVIDSYDSTFNAGSPHILDYSLSLIEGVTLGTI